MAIQRIVAGDTLVFSDTAPQYPPSGGWTLKYRLTPIFTTPVQAPITLTATPVGEEYQFAVSPGTTAGWKAGSYSWDRWVEKPGGRQTLDPIGPFAPTVVVLPNPTTKAQGYDPRSTAKKALDAMNVVLANWTASSHVQEYTIGNRSMRFATRLDARQERDYWAFIVWKENATLAMTEGLPNPRQIRVRLSRA